eukprot:2634923-Rhodomonas_salina.1
MRETADASAASLCWITPLSTRNAPHPLSFPSPYSPLPPSPSSFRPSVRLSVPSSLPPESLPQHFARCAGLHRLGDASS